MRRPAILLNLFLLVVCPGVCLAEAAEELRRSLAELAQDQVIEPPETAGCQASEFGARAPELRPIARTTPAPDGVGFADLDRPRAFPDPFPRGPDGRARSGPDRAPTASAPSWLLDPNARC